MKKILLLLTIPLFISCITENQTSKYEKVIDGKDLEKVPLISFDAFFNQWVLNKKIQKVNLETRELNKDDKFTYFGKPSLELIGTKWLLYKVYNDTIEMNFPNYKEFYGSDLESFLWKEVVPKEDLELWNLNMYLQENNMSPKCDFKKNKPIYNYSLNDKKVILKMTLEIECEELEKLKNKTYIASYDLLLKQFENVSIVKK